MVRIYGISAGQLDMMRSFVSDADEWESVLYNVRLYLNVYVHCSFGDVEIGDGQKTIKLNTLDFEKIVIV